MSNMLQGYKTYIVAALMIVAAGLHSQGYITKEAYDLIEVVLIGGGFAALRAGVSKAS